jgi:hypothetical protein
MRANFQKQIASIRSQITSRLQALTEREQKIVILCVVVLVIAAVGWVGQTASEAFDDQASRIAKAELQLSKLASEIVQYTKWKQKKDAIEERYRRVEIKEGVPSHLENLVRTKAEITRGFSIKDLGVREFGREYQQEAYTIAFATANLESLVGFLKELSFGSRPVLLSQLDIEMPAHRSALDVRLEVAAIRKKAES